MMSNPLVRPILYAAPEGDGEDVSDLPSAATRHLCAGVYVDSEFRALVLGKVHNDSRRRVAPSYGFDLVPVVRHAWWSWFLDTGHRVVIALCVGLGSVLGNVPGMVLVVSVTTLCWLIAQAARMFADTLRLQALALTEEWFERPLRLRAERPDSLLRKRKRLLKVVLAGCVGVGAAPFAVTNWFSVSLSEASPVAVAVGGGLVASAVLTGVVRQLLLNAIHRAESLRPTTMTAREQVIDEQQTHACVIYRRPKTTDEPDPLDLFPREDAPSPFVGSGKLINRWLPPMTIALLRPGLDDMERREHSTPPFWAHELVERLRTALEQLGTDPGVEHLPGLQVRDRLYIAEPDVAADPSLLRSDVTEHDVHRVIDDHRSAVHHFLETSAPIAGGELVTTVLVRVSIKGRCLSLDVATSALTRTPQDYQMIDGFAEHGASSVLRSALRSVLALPTESMRLWRLAEVPVVLGRGLWAVKDRTHIPCRGCAVGAQVAIRMEKADDWKNAQLDETTIYDHMKIIEQRILNATEDFLKAYDVDTSAFEKQATNIINSGVLNMGGRTEVHQSAIGEKAQTAILAAAMDARDAKEGENA